MKSIRTLMGIMLCIMLVFTVVGKVIAEDTAKPAEITGTIEKGELKADDGAMVKVAGKDVAAHEGKKVKVTGTVAEDAATKAKTITATAVEEVK